MERAMSTWIRVTKDGSGVLVNLELVRCISPHAGGCRLHFDNSESLIVAESDEEVLKRASRRDEVLQLRRM